MRNIRIVFIGFLITSILAGCSDFTKALSGIDGQAQKAASALTPEALNIRSINIEYKNESFTIDELFTTILRDTFWEYEENNNSQILTIKGTWQDGLFEEYDFTEEIRNDLRKDGKVTVILEFLEGHILTDNIKVRMSLDEKTIVDENGEKAQEKLFDAYLLR